MSVGLLTFTLLSIAFKNGEWIPKKYTSKGEDFSPPLIWENTPSGTKTFALICHDPDAPVQNGWTHWILWNIPTSLNSLPEDFGNKNHHPRNGIIQGTNSWGNDYYGGPAPPNGTHRYYFTLYALDTKLKLKKNATMLELQEAMKSHIIEKTEIMGKFSADGRDL